MRNIHFPKCLINYQNSFFKYLIYIKAILVFLLLFYYNYKNVYLKITKTEDKFFINENKYYLKFLTLNSKPSNLNDSLYLKERNDILSMISKINRKNITNISTIYFYYKGRFGNCIASLNKLIYLCEIIGCKNIILDKKIFWFIQNNLTLANNNININIDEINNIKNFSQTYISDNIFYDFYNIKPDIKIDLLRNEIINNLPKLIINDNDLYIHIRSGDIFNTCPIYPYAQPPLCFYNNIIQNFKFRRIILLSSDKENPTIPKLMKRFPNIIYQKNSLSTDISVLISSPNIVSSISSFLISIIQLNYNLRFLWDYNIYNIKQKIRHYHYDFYNYHKNNFTIYRMEPSLLYKNKMCKWKNSKIQRKLMIKEKCINFFRVIYK